MPYERNPRNNDEAIDKVAESIKEFGFKVPIIIDAAGVIVAGHTRYKAAKKLGIETVPCIIADDLTPYQISAFRIADNKVSEFSNWDFTLLEKELSELDGMIDMSKFGFDIDIDFDLTENEEKPETQNEAKLNMETVIVIKCPSEEELEETFLKLSEEGYECQLLTL